MIVRVPKLSKLPPISIKPFIQPCTSLFLSIDLFCPINQRHNPSITMGSNNLVGAITDQSPTSYPSSSAVSYACLFLLCTLLFSTHADLFGLSSSRSSRLQQTLNIRFDIISRKQRLRNAKARSRVEFQVSLGAKNTVF